MFFEIWYNNRMKITKLSHAYLFPRFRPVERVKEMPDNPYAVVVTLRRTSSKKKNQNAPTVGHARPAGMITGLNGYGTFPVGTYGSILSLKYGVLSAGGAAW